MRLFPQKKKSNANVRRTKKAVTIKKPQRWLQFILKGMAVSSVVAVISLGLWQLNQKMTVAHWDIQAQTHIKAPIEQYFAEKEQFDFWHTRASVIQQDLLARIPDIQNIEVSRTLPDGLRIQTVARQPFALWEKRGASVMLIDEQGEAYRPLQRGENLDLPLLRLSQADLKRATLLLQHLMNSTPSKALALSEVIVEHQDWRLNFAYGEQWQLNHTSLEADLPKVLNILSKPRWARGHWRMDARIPQRWFIRPAKQEVI